MAIDVWLAWGTFQNISLSGLPPILTSQVWKHAVITGRYHHVALYQHRLPRGKGNDGSRLRCKVDITVYSMYNLMEGI